MPNLYCLSVLRYEKQITHSRLTRVAAEFNEGTTDMLLQMPAGLHNKRWAEMKKKNSFPELVPILQWLLKGSPNTVLGKWTDEYQRHFPVLMNAC